MKPLLVFLFCACSVLRAQDVLTLEAIAADAKIWPVEVMVTVDHKLPVIINGKVAKTLKIAPGTMYKVKSIGAAGVTVFALGGPKTFPAEDTDLIARAEQNRTRLSAPAEAPPAPDQAPASSLKTTEAKGTPKPYRGPLPFNILLPRGFVGPFFSQKGPEKIYGYLRQNPSGSNPAAIQIAIRDLKPEEEALPVDALLQQGVEESTRSGWSIDASPAVHGVLGNVPAREFSWKGSFQGGRMAGKTYGFVKYGRLYSVTIADAESLAPNAISELDDALLSLRFGERPPPPGAGAPVVTEAALPPPAADTLAAKLQGQLVSVQGSRIEPFDAARLGGKKYLAVYFSASWCGPCREFTPTLVEWYENHRADGDKFDLIFVSADRDEKSMAGYMVGDGMPWPAVSFSRARSNPLSKYGGRGIPNLVILDERGIILSGSFDGDNYLGPNKPLQDLDRLLKAN